MKKIIVVLFLNIFLFSFGSWEAVEDRAIGDAKELRLIVNNNKIAIESDILDKEVKLISINGKRYPFIRNRENQLVISKILTPREYTELLSECVNTNIEIDIQLESESKIFIIKNKGVLASFIEAGIE